MRFLTFYAASLALGITSLRAELSFLFDYSLDSSGFFSGENIGRRAYLEAAGDYLSGLIGNTSMEAITPDANNSWMPLVFDPNDYTSYVALGNISVPADTIHVYAGATSFESENTVAYGGPGGGSVPDGSSMDWISTLLYRGNDGYRMPPIGTVTFTLDWEWYFDDDISTVEPFPGQIDFFSVSIHELMHVLGFATLETWMGLVDQEEGVFLGATSILEYGSAVPLDSLLQHWQEGTNSSIVGTSIAQETAMDPTIFDGSRKYATDLDMAGLTDIGYTISSVPEPTCFSLLCGILAGVLVFRFRRRVSNCH